MSYNTFMKFFFSFLVSIIFFISLSLPAQAQLSGGTIDNTMEAILKNMSTKLVDEEVTAIVNPSNAGSAEKTTIGEIDSEAGDDGSIHIMGSTLAQFISTKPASSEEYFASLFQNIGLPINRPVYAQNAGIGYDALKPILTIWRSFRNLAYLLYVLLFVVIGFMIMMRRKIDPQTVISIQTALPRLVVTLILITFSYAIAGLAIDLMYVAIYIPAHLLSSPAGDVFKNAEDVTHILFNNNLVSLIMPMNAVDLTEAPSEAFSEIVGSLIGFSLEGWDGMDGSKLVKLFMGGMMLYSMFKLYITLGVGFFKIILSVVFAPIQIMLNVIPGSDAFSKWIRGLISNVAMFPAVAIIFMIAAALMGPTNQPNNKEVNRWGVQDEIGYQTDLSEDSGWIPPFLLLRNVSSGAAVSGAVNPAIALVGFFALVISPQVATMTRDALKVEQSKYGSAMGQAFGFGVGASSILPRKLWQQRESRIAADRQAESIGQAIRPTVGR